MHRPASVVIGWAMPFLLYLKGLAEPANLNNRARGSSCLTGLEPFIDFSRDITSAPRAKCDFQWKWTVIKKQSQAFSRLSVPVVALDCDLFDLLQLYRLHRAVHKSIALIHN